MSSSVATPLSATVSSHARWRSMSPVITTPTEPRRTLEAAAAALRSWTPRQHLAAAMFSVAFALLIGVPTVLIPNPVFGRQVPVQAWSYPVWIASSILGGMLAATYVRGARDQAAVEVAESVDDATAAFERSVERPSTDQSVTSASSCSSARRMVSTGMSSSAKRPFFCRPCSRARA